MAGPAPAHDNVDLSDWLADVVGEHADVVRALVDGSVQPGAVRPALHTMNAAHRATVSRELDQLIDVLAAFKGELDLASARPAR